LFQANKPIFKKFLDDFKNLDQSTFEYKVYVKEDGVTFYIIQTTSMKKFSMKF
jgi:NMD protein affecting ribosome stability and mRNA decay